MTNRARAGERIDALTRHNRPIRSEVDILSRAFAPRQNPHVAPPLTITDAPAVCLIVNMTWVSHVIGVLETLNQPDAWVGDADEKHRAQNEVQLLIEMLMTGDACMVDPCCPETNEILTEIKVLNQTIVNNQVTIINNQEITIDNDTTIINQNIQVQANQYLTQYQSFITNNQTINQFNEMLYDGVPQSIAPELGADFGGSDASEDALCAAIKSYIDTLVYVFGMQAAALSGIATVITGIGLALAPATLGASIIGVALIGAIGGSAALWSAIVNDPEAKRKVACCMFDALKDVPMSQAAFKSSCDSCDLGGTYESHEGFLAAQMAHCNQLDENWLAFVRALGQSQGGGRASDCQCGCADELFLTGNTAGGDIYTVITATEMTDVYRIVQNTHPDPTNDGRYIASVVDALGQCLKFEQVSGGTQVPIYASERVGCVGVGDGCDSEDLDAGGPVAFAPTTGTILAWQSVEPIDTLLRITCCVPDEV